ncbi:MAG: winged helix-turn-helix transcriptional regulator, partial [Anaeroplasmataceae bacterium]|nr:winged helix-turn-helix transcriptional regulator [Anaeroplasmataceae bacterium]
MREYNEMEIKILKLINEQPSLTIDEMCEHLYLARTPLTKYLRTFKEEKLIGDNGQKKPHYKRL